MKRTKQSRQVIGYLRVSTVDQDTNKNEAAILKFANQKDFGQVEFISEKVSGLRNWKNRKLAEVVERLQKGDVLIVPELSRLGRSLVNVLEVLNILSNKGVKVYAVKEGFQLNGKDLQSKMVRTMFALFAEIESDLISIRTKEGLQAARAAGKTLGRPKGPGKQKLEPRKAEIIELLKIGVSKARIAKKVNVTSQTLYNFLNRQGLTDTKPDYLEAIQ